MLTEQATAAAIERPKRIAYLDAMRVTATFAVILLHVSAQNWFYSDITGPDWQAFNIYNSLTRWSVPVFVMISGALFLRKDVRIRTIYTKYVPRLAAAFFVWSALYALFAGGGVKAFFFNVARGYIHMWFIPMIIGIYLCIPLIRLLVQKKAFMEYFLLLAFIFTFAVPQFVQMVQDFHPGTMASLLSTFNKTLGEMDLGLLSGYTVYFVLGYYLDGLQLPKSARIAVYLLGLMGFASTAGLTALLSSIVEAPLPTYYDNFTVNVLLESLAVFTWFKYHVNARPRFEKAIAALSKYSFGAYLVHYMVIDQFVLWGLTTLAFPAVLSVPAIGVLVLVISFAVSAAVNHIPFLNKTIV